MFQNNDKKDDHNLVGGIMTVIAIIALMLFFFLCFLAFVGTLIAFAAWFRPLRLGRVTIEPEDARAFVWRGVVGAIVLPMFVAFMVMFMNEPVDKEVWPYLFLIGYVMGSVGVKLFFAWAGHQERTEAAVAAPPPVTSPPPVKGLPPRESPPFRYASWDDEGRG